MPPAIEVSTFCNCHWRFIVTNSNNFKRERYAVRLKLQIKQRTKTITISTRLNTQGKLQREQRRKVHDTKLTFVAMLKILPSGEQTA